MIEYKGYTGVFEFDPELLLFSGHVVDLRDEIYFEEILSKSSRLRCGGRWTTTSRSAGFVEMSRSGRSQAG